MPKKDREQIRITPELKAQIAMECVRRNLFEYQLIEEAWKAYADKAVIRVDATLLTEFQAHLEKMGLDMAPVIEGWISGYMNSESVRKGLPPASHVGLDSTEQPAKNRDIAIGQMAYIERARDRLLEALTGIETVLHCAGGQAEDVPFADDLTDRERAEFTAQLAENREITEGLDRLIGVPEETPPREKKDRKSPKKGKDSAPRHEKRTGS